MKKVFTILAALLLGAAGATAQTWTNGSTTATLSNGVMTISGTGAMNFNYSPPWASDKSQITQVVIGNNVTSISTGAFYGCTNLTSVTIGSSVTNIYAIAFYGCTSLTQITIPNSVTSTQDAVFYGCTSLTSVTLSNSLTSIGAAMFSGCTSLTRITIPNGVTSISSAAFASCTSLAQVTIPNSVTSISSAAFAGCTSLAQIAIPSSVTSIGNNAFASCASLTSVTIPSSVTSIDAQAFVGCTSLTSATVLRTTPPTLGANAFQSVHANFCVTVPSGAFASYLANSSWQSYLCRATVTFNSQGGNNVNPQIVQPGSKATAPNPPPTRVGYTFDGWYKEVACTNAWNFSTDVVTTNTTLYAKWVVHVNNSCVGGQQFTIRIPFRSLSFGDTAQYRWYRNEQLIVSSDGIATSADSYIICTIPANEAYGTDQVFYFDYRLNDDCPTCWTSSPRYTINFLSAP